MKTALLLSKANLELSIAEATTRIEPEEQELEYNLLLIDKEPGNEELDKLALTRKAYKILLEASTEKEIEQKLLKQPPQIQGKNKTYRVRSENLLHGKRTLENLGGIAKALNMHPSIRKANLENPDLDFAIIKAKKTYLALKTWENTDKAKERKAHERPYNHPTSLDPKTARAMINLAGAKKEILDPFCGAGGILIEAGLTGLKATGIDFDSRMIERAKANTEHYNVKASLVHGNALDREKEAECIVTDIPYGKNSRASEEISSLLKKFLEKYSKLTKKIVISHPSTLDIKEFLPSTGMERKSSYSTYIHKKLTRTISVLEAKDTQS